MKHLHVFMILPCVQEDYVSAPLDCHKSNFLLHNDNKVLELEVSFPVFKFFPQQFTVAAISDEQMVRFFFFFFAN